MLTTCGAEFQSSREQHLFSHHTGLDTSLFTSCSSPSFFILLRTRRHFTEEGSSCSCGKSSNPCALSSIESGFGSAAPRAVALEVHFSSPLILACRQPHTQCSSTATYADHMLLDQLFLCNASHLSTLVTTHTDQRDVPPKRE